MVSVATLRGVLPPFRNKVKIIVPGQQSTDDIEKEILKAHKEYETDYDKIYGYFDTGDIYTTSREIWQFLKWNLPYNAETGDEQSSKSPAAILEPGQKIDCKHYSLFAGGVLDAIKANMGDTWDWCYRFASDKSIKEATHVFVVVFDGKKEICIDPVLTNFDQKKKWLYAVDETPMSIVRISGVNDAPTVSRPVTVGKKASWIAFCTEVNLNLFSLKTFLTKHPDIVYGRLQDYCIQNGFDFDRLVNVLK